MSIPVLTSLISRPAGTTPDRHLRQWRQRRRRPVYTAVIRPNVKAGFASACRSQHQSTLLTLATRWVSRLPGPGGRRAMADVFKASHTAPRVCYQQSADNSFRSPRRLPLNATHLRRDCRFTALKVYLERPKSNRDSTPQWRTLIDHHHRPLGVFAMAARTHYVQRQRLDHGQPHLSIQITFTVARRDESSARRQNNSQINRLIAFFRQPLLQRPEYHGHECVSGFQHAAPYHPFNGNGTIN